MQTRKLNTPISTVINADKLVAIEKHIRSTKVLLDKATEIGVAILRNSLLNEALIMNAVSEGKATSLKDKAAIKHDRNKLKSGLAETETQLNQLIIMTAMDALMGSMSSDELLDVVSKL